MAGFNKKDNAEAVTTVKNGIKVCKITSKTKSEASNRWTDNKRLGKRCLINRCLNIELPQRRREIEEGRMGIQDKVSIKKGE